MEVIRIRIPDLYRIRLDPGMHSPGALVLIVVAMVMFTVSSDVTTSVGRANLSHLGVCRQVASSSTKN